MTSWHRFISRQCPLHVQSASWDDLVLLMEGKGWTFQCLSPWRVMRAGKLVGSFDQPMAGELVTGLIGMDVVECNRLTASPCADLQMVFSDQSVLDVFVTGTRDPWVLRLPLPPTLVPGPGLPDDLDVELE
jgi:hypothetical protein